MSEIMKTIVSVLSYLKDLSKFQVLKFIKNYVVNNSFPNKYEDFDFFMYEDIKFAIFYFCIVIFMLIIFIYYVNCSKLQSM